MISLNMERWTRLFEGTRQSRSKRQAPGLEFEKGNFHGRVLADLFNRIGRALISFQPTFCIHYPTEVSPSLAGTHRILSGGRFELFMAGREIGNVSLIE